MLANNQNAGSVVGMKSAQISAMKAEQDDSLRLRRAEQALAAYRQQENDARRALADAVAATKRAKEKYEALFAECEQRAGERRRSGLIVNSSCY